MPENLLGVDRSESAWILKSPLIMSSDGDGTKISRRFWNSSRKVDILEDGRAIDVKKDGFLIARKFSSHKFGKIQVEVSCESGKV